MEIGTGVCARERVSEGVSEGGSDGRVCARER